MKSLDKTNRKIKKLIKKYLYISYVEPIDKINVLILAMNKLIKLIEDKGEKTLYAWVTEIGWKFYCKSEGINKWDELEQYLFKYRELRPVSYLDTDFIRELYEEGYITLVNQENISLYLAKTTEEGEETLRDYIETVVNPKEIIIEDIVIQLK